MTLNCEAAIRSFGERIACAIIETEQRHVGLVAFDRLAERLELILTHPNAPPSSPTPERSP